MFLAANVDSMIEHRKVRCVVKDVFLLAVVEGRHGRFFIQKLAVPGKPCIV